MTPEIGSNKTGAPKLPEELRNQIVPKVTNAMIMQVNKKVKAVEAVPKTAHLPFPEIEAFPDPINPEALLSSISEVFLKFIVMDKEQADAAALWTAFTYFIDVVKIAPLAIINAPEKSCGKTQLLELLGKMVAKPFTAANCTPAALFRSIDRWQPTILIDEADTFAKESFELRGMINAGHSRSSAYVVRVVGDTHEPKQFSVWGAKALAGIALEKHLSDATMSRGIHFNLRKKLDHEKVDRLRNATPELFDVIRAKLTRFALDYSEAVEDSRPVLPEELSDRDQDNWESLLAIAACGGEIWIEKATVSALKLSASPASSTNTANELLADIAEIFYSRGIQKIASIDLIEALNNDPEKTWGTYNRGKPMDRRQLAKQLAPYGIHPKTVRFTHDTPKGYDLEQFVDAFSRYLSPSQLPPQQNTDAEPNTGKGYSVAAKKFSSKPPNKAFSFDEDEY